MLGIQVGEELLDAHGQCLELELLHDEGNAALAFSAEDVKNASAGRPDGVGRDVLNGADFVQAICGHIAS